jgi:hypothetical protein
MAIAALMGVGTAVKGEEVPSLDLDFDGQASSYRRTSTSPTAPKANGDELATSLITCVRNSTAFFLNSSGNLQQAAAGVPRVEYDTSGNPLGLLVEEARTNLVGQSEINKAGGYWIQGGTTANQLTDLTGNYLGQFGGMRVESNGATWHHTRHEMPGSFTSGTAYAFTLFFRFETRQDGTDGQIRVQFRDLDGGNNTLMSGSSSGVSAASAQNAGTTTDIVLTDMGGGNHKLTCKFTPNFTGSRLRVDIGPNSAQGPANGQPGDTIVVLACQMEEGEGPTSYIPTSGNNTANRPRDEISISAGAWFNASEMSVAFEASGLVTGGITRRLLSINDGGSQVERCEFLAANTGKLQQVVATNGSNVSQFGVDSAPAVSVAGRFAVNNHRHAVNGVAGGSNATAAMPSGLDRIFIGRGSAGNMLNGHIRRLRYFPRAINDAQLVKFTST